MDLIKINSKNLKEKIGACNDNEPGCCGQSEETVIAENITCVNEGMMTPGGFVRRVLTKLDWRDRLVALKARLGINRMSFKVTPGLYCVGEPDASSPVFVTANYQLSFDSLRKELSDLGAWILVLDTKGINVWCAAGKGTFGTKELVKRIHEVKLGKIVSHRKMILPQLGAPGIAAHEVQKQSGFKVIYGPVRASDIKRFMLNGMQADVMMRTVKFTLKDRIVLTPIEIVQVAKPSMIVFGILFILNAIGFSHFGRVELFAYVGAVLVGGLITPVLLPWIPGRAFSFKGGLLGILWAILINLFNGGGSAPSYGWLEAVALLLILPSISSYGAMNFTGCSTYTSKSGVNQEMKIALPIILLSMGAGILLLVVDCIANLIS